MQALGETLSKIIDWVQERLPVSLTTPTHPYRPEDAVWVKEWNVQVLKPGWRGPFVVILFTPTAVKVAEIAPWIQPLSSGTASMTQPHHVRSPSRMPIPFPGRRLLPRRHQGTTNEGTTTLL
jgi:hypothetical protein